MKNEKKFLSLSDIKAYATSATLASAILFGYGYHATVDAILLTVIWAFLLFSTMAMITFTVVLVAIRKHDKRDDKELGKFYKALSDMHSGIIKRFIGFVFIGYWLYALVVQEWTVTAVFYVILTMYVQLFIFLTKDIAKAYFVAQLKGEGISE